MPWKRPGPWIVLGLGLLLVGWWVGYVPHFQGSPPRVVCDPGAAPSESTCHLTSPGRALYCPQPASNETQSTCFHVDDAPWWEVPAFYLGNFMAIGGLASLGIAGWRKLKSRRTARLA